MCANLILLDLIIHRFQSLIKVPIDCYNACINSLKFTIDMFLQFLQLLLNLIDEGLVLLGELHRLLITLPDAFLLAICACFRHES